MIGPDLYSPRLIRVVQGIQKCPRCEKACLHNILQAGWGFQSCGLHKAGGDPRGLARRNGRDNWKGRCDGEWWSLALPPDAPAGHLAMLCGEDAARILLLRAFPHSAALEPPELWGLLLNEGGEQAWIQVAVRPRERHLHRRSKIGQLIASFIL